jgi:hypothetical protein
MSEKVKSKLEATKTEIPKWSDDSSQDEGYK